MGDVTDGEIFSDRMFAGLSFSIKKIRRNLRFFGNAILGKATV
jgi:hypothetical protein